MQNFEILNIPGFYDALDASLMELSILDLEQNNLDIPITIVLKTTGEILPDGTRVVNVLTYVNSTNDEILADLDDN